MDDISAKSKACDLFKCSPKGIKFFEESDNINPENTLKGYISRKDGLYGGSLYITSVNNSPCRQVIYGTPKLSYPYKNYNSYEYKIPKAHKVFFGNKWNGMNVLVFKYKDASGKEFYSMKSKGSVFLHDGNFGDFLKLSFKALKCEIDDHDSLKSHPKLSLLKDPLVQSISFELCGRQEPHLVNYDFDIDLKPLFYTFTDGSISPVVGEEVELEYGPIELEHSKVIEIAKDYQKNDEIENEKYRKEKGLKRKYEYDHFIKEGRVLYCLDEKGKLIHRTMFKIKPRDIEEVHWGNFDTNMKGRVVEALKKLHLHNKPLTSESLKEELDMGTKEWGKFGRDVTKYMNEIKHQIK